MDVSVCYRVEVFFLKVGESCINFKETEDMILVDSFMRTVNIGSLARRIYDNGYSEINKNSLRPYRFYFHQEEGNFKRDQEYFFIDNKIQVRETKFRGLTDNIEKDEKKVYEDLNYLDPYTAALYLFMNVEKNRSGYIKLFYDDRFYKIPYDVRSEEKIKVDNTLYDTLKVVIKPKIRGKGLLKPKGDWTLWIDKKRKVPVKMNVGFIIGSVNVYVDRIR